MCLSVRMLVCPGFIKLFNAYKINEIFSQLYSLLFKAMSFCQKMKREVELSIIQALDLLADALQHLMQQLTDRWLYPNYCGLIN